MRTVGLSFDTQTWQSDYQQDKAPAMESHLPEKAVWRPPSGKTACLEFSCQECI